MTDVTSKFAQPAEKPVDPLLASLTFATMFDGTMTQALQKNFDAVVAMQAKDPENVQRGAYIKNVEAAVANTASVKNSFKPATTFKA